MATDWPLIGRSDELAHVAALLTRPDSSGVVLVGPAGVGKTRLATACLELGAASGFATARVVTSRAASSIPFGAIASLLPPGGVALERGLNALRQATLALTELAAGKPLLLMVDDAHALDDSSALLLQQVAASRLAFVVVTLRSGEPAPETVTALWKDHGVERLSVGPLAREVADRFVSTMLGGPVDHATLASLWAKTHGNALFLRELVLGAVHAGALALEAGVWNGVGELAPSDRLSEIVESRLSGLSRSESEALELVAFGEPIGISMLSNLTDADSVESLERNGLVVVERSGRRTEIRLAHPMYGEVLRSRTPAIRARSVRRVLAEALEAVGARRRGDALRVSLWRLDGGGMPPMPLLLAGTAQARFANDRAVAQRLAWTAFEIEPTFESGMLLLDVLYQSDRARECPAIFRAMAPLAVTDAQIALLALARATTLFWKLADAEGAWAVLLEALGRIESPEHRDEVTSFLALMEVQAGRPLDALARVADAVAIDNGRPFVLAALPASLATSIAGRCLDAIDITDRAFAAHNALSGELTMYQSGLLLVHKAVALNEIGRIGEALEMASFVRLAAADSNDLASQGFSCIALAKVCVNAGRLGEATTWAGQAIEMLRRWGHPGPLRWALGYLALASALSGDRRMAADAIDELDVLAPHPAHMLDVDIIRARAWLAVLDDHVAAARVLLLDAAAEFREGGQGSFEMSVLFDLARLGMAGDVAERLAAIASNGQSELHAAMAGAARALADADVTAIADHADLFAEMGANVFAAEFAAAAGEGFGRAGDQRRTAEWARRAADLAALCEGARTPGLRRVDEPVRLTNREREIAELAGQGLSSKLIGDRLFVSGRTVDNHLARIYTKLGVSSRAELAEVLGGIE